MVNDTKNVGYLKSSPPPIITLYKDKAVLFCCKLQQTKSRTNYLSIPDQEVIVNGFNIAWDWYVNITFTILIK